MDAERFRLLSGGKPSRKCGIMSSGNHLFFSEDGLRMLVTNDLDLSNARYAYCCPCTSKSCFLVLFMTSCVNGHSL